MGNAISTLFHPLIEISKTCFPSPGKNKYVHVHVGNYPVSINSCICVKSTGVNWYGVENCSWVQGPTSNFQLSSMQTETCKEKERAEGLSPWINPKPLGKLYAYLIKNTKTKILKQTCICTCTCTYVLATMSSEATSTRVPVSFVNLPTMKIPMLKSAQAA